MRPQNALTTLYSIGCAHGRRSNIGSDPMYTQALVSSIVEFKMFFFAPMGQLNAHAVAAFKEK